MKPEKRRLFCWLYGLCAFIVGIIGLILLYEIISLVLEKETPFLRLSIPYYYAPIHSQEQIWGMLGAIPTIVIMSIIFIPWSMKLFNRTKLYSIRSNELSSSDIPLKFSYVLYLRSFKADTSKIIKFTSQTEEEILVNSLSPIGKTVAIGSPKDEIPPLGGYRIYVKDDKCQNSEIKFSQNEALIAEWQNTVIKLSKDAKLIALRIGDTAGLSWEIQFTLMNITDLQKLIFLIPDIQKIDLSFFGKLEKVIREKRSDDVQITPCYFNKQGWGTVSSIIYFEKQYNDSDKKTTYIMKQSLVPRRTIWNRFGNLSPAFQKAMFPVYEQFGKLSFKKKFWNALSTYFFYICTAIIIICSLFTNLKQTPKQSVTAFLHTQAIHEAEEIYPGIAKTLEEKAQAYKSGYIFNAGYLGSVYLNDEHLNEFIALDLQVYKKVHSEKLSIEESVAQLSKDDAVRYNNFIIKSALMFLLFEKPEYTVFYTPEEFNKKLSEARSSLTEEQYKTVNDFLTSRTDTANDSYIDYLEVINTLPDKSIKAFLFRGYFLNRPDDKQ
ncbi:MAG: hypothetical protein IKX40_12380 [Thermoguttaceae bacterium]|nr:hypothetical protein [Thermoguttaceae bacterium]